MRYFSIYTTLPYNSREVQGTHLGGHISVPGCMRNNVGDMDVWENLALRAHCFSINLREHSRGYTFSNWHAYITTMCML
jgi:hypothetical protein